MDYHQNARLTVRSRELLARKVLDKKCTLKLAEASFKVRAKTAPKWVQRYRELGSAGLCDRSSRPHHSPRKPPPRCLKSSSSCTACATTDGASGVNSA